MYRKKKKGLNNGPPRRFNRVTYRAQIYDRINNAILDARKKDKALAVLFLDLDGFSKINKAIGRAEADSVLVEVGKRLVHALGKKTAVTSIDAISHATIAKMDGQDYLNMDRISTGGNAPEEVYINYLRKHMSIKNILICTDNDAAGAKFTEKIKEALQQNGFTLEHGYHCERQIPTGYKDFNEYLHTYKAALKEQSEPSGEKESAKESSSDGFFPEPEEGECER